MRGVFYLLVVGLIGCDSGDNGEDLDPRPLRIRLLGHASRHHISHEYAPSLQRARTRAGIHATCPEDPDELNEENLALYDGELLCANHDSLPLEHDSGI